MFVVQIAKNFFMGFIRDMKVHLITNNKVLFMPLSKAAGTEAERFQKAADVADNLIGRLKKAYAHEDRIARSEFKNVFQQSIDAPIKLSVEDKNSFMPLGIGYKITDKAVINGYYMFLPTDAGKISKNSSLVFIKKAQEILLRIFNPKITRREANLFNIPAPRVKGILQFERKLLSKKPVTEKEIRETIKGLTPQEKIDVIQMLRYRLKVADDIQKTGLYAKTIDKSMKIEKYPYEQWKYGEKLELLNERLLKLLNKERLKNKSL